MPGDKGPAGMSRVCATGAAGYIGSWLVKKFLDRGCTAHATVRNLGDEKKTELLRGLPGAAERLVLFEADIYDAATFEPAITGCEFVFLVATTLQHNSGRSKDGLFQLTEDGDGGVVMDTGTAVTRLPPDTYTALRDALASAVGGLPRAPAMSLFDTCYDLSGYASVRVPTVAFYFGDDGAVLTLPARNLLVAVDGGVYCLAFAASSSGLSILGNIQQEGIQITVDSANGYVGFGPSTC